MLSVILEFFKLGTTKLGYITFYFYNYFFDGHVIICFMFLFGIAFKGGGLILTLGVQINTSHI